MAYNFAKISISPKPYEIYSLKKRKHANIAIYIRLI